MTDHAATPLAPQASMTDWLRLHGLAARDLRPLLKRQVPPAAPNSDSPLDSPITEADIAARLGRALPELAPLLSTVMAQVRIDLEPDRSRFPRAFTLRDEATGLVLISCPCDGTSADLFRLAHEIGHACQSLASPEPAPPILRETAAYLAEGLLVRDALHRGDPLADTLASRHAADSHSVATRDGARLARDLDLASAPYSYRWNYPPARAIAATALAHWGAAELMQIFTAPPPLSVLLDRMRPTG